MGEVLWEERVYPAGHWACVTRGEDLYEQSISNGFMKLMRFICKENSAGQTPPTKHLLASPTDHIAPPTGTGFHGYTFCSWQKLWIIIVDRV